MRFYTTDKGKIYNTFLDCIEKEKYSISDLNEMAIIEFLRFGALYFNETFIHGVKKVFSHQKFTLDSKNGFEEIESIDISMSEGAQDKSSENRFLKFFNERESFLKERKISVDLTGGIDSRLIATILQSRDIPFHTVYSLDSGSEEEAEIVKRVADKLHRPLDILESRPLNNKKRLENLFELSDAHWDLLGLISLTNTQKWRKESGFDLVITGIGGELYKDFWWQQDFPFYKKEYPNIDKLINIRMYPQPLQSEWFQGEYSKTQKNSTHVFKEKLKPFFQSTNTQTYDQIYLNVRIKEQVSVLTCATLNYIDTYSPLLEQELLQIGYNLPRRKRFFNTFHRNLITKLNPKVAKIPTTEGRMSVSSHRSNKLQDSWHYGMDKTSKIKAKTNSKRNGKMVKSENEKLDQNEFISQKVEESIVMLKEAGIFSAIMPSSIHEVPPKLHGRILTLGMLVNKLS